MFGFTRSVREGFGSRRCASGIGVLKMLVHPRRSLNPNSSCLHTTVQVATIRPMADRLGIETGTEVAICQSRKAEQCEPSPVCLAIGVAAPSAPDRGIQAFSGPDEGNRQKRSQLCLTFVASSLSHAPWPSAP